MTSTQEMADIARRLVLWQEPDAALANPKRFLAYLMTLGTWREIQTVKNVMGWDAFCEALKNAPSGVFDRKSWTYWHGFLGLQEPEMPQDFFAVFSYIGINFPARECAGI